MEFWNVYSGEVRLGIGYSPDIGVILGMERTGHRITPIIAFSSWDEFGDFIDMLVEVYSKHAPSVADIPEAFLEAFPEEGLEC